MRLLVFSTRFQPIPALEWVVVVVSAIQFAYTVSPLYAQSVAMNGAQPFAAALASPLFLYLFVTGLLISAIIVTVGIWKNLPKLRSAGMFAQFLLRFFNVLTTILAAGLFPLTWIYAATVVLFCIVLWGAERIEVNRNDS